MKKADFKPVWDAFNLAPVVETLGVNVVVPFKIRATVMLDDNEGQIEIDPADVPHITSLRKDGIDEAYTVAGNIITFSASPNVAILEIERSGTVEYSVFAGEIVPGLKLVNGRLKGIVGNIPYAGTHTYRFGLRGRWNGETADVVKTWDANPVQNQITWNSDTLPEVTKDTSFVSGRDYYTIGEFRRGQSIEVSIDLYNPDFTPLNVEYREVTDMVAGDGRFSGVLPLGLKLDNNPFVISGFIPAEALSGDYFIELFVDEPFGPTPIVLHAKLLGDQFDKGTAINRLTWATPENLGTIIEGLPCTFKVKATNSTGAVVTHRLAAGSRPLPIGMTLTPQGEIRGRAPHVDADTVVSFAVKASSGPYVSQKHFTFKLFKKFEQSRHLTVTLPITGYTRRAWQGYAAQIDSGRRFRSADPNFGSAKPSLLLIRGLRPRKIEMLDYDKPFELIAGPFKWARVIQDDVHIYDVVYREFFDPMHNAGGFVPSDVDVIEDPVYYPQNPTVRITEGTVRNLRADLVLHLGLCATPDKQHVLGPSGGELLDRYMSSTQLDGSKLGFISAGIIDYVQPTKGRIVANSLQYGDIPVGTVVAFDRLRVEDGTSSYYYYLGSENNDGDVDAERPQPIYDLHVDGIPAEDDHATHPLPALTWASDKDFATFELRFYNGQTLLRTVSGYETTAFSYTSAMQAEDGLPAHVFVEVFSVIDNVKSLPVEASVKIRSGYGFAWGFQYGK